MKIDHENLNLLNVKIYDLNFCCYLADRFMGGEEINYSSRWSKDNKYRNAVLEELQDEVEKGTATKEDVELIIRVHKKLRKEDLTFTMKDAAIHEVKSRGRNERNKKLNIGFWTLVFCLKELIGKWDRISEILSSIKRDDGTPLIEGEWSSDTLREEYSKRKNIFKFYRAKEMLEKLYEEYKKDPAFNLEVQRWEKLLRD